MDARVLIEALQGRGLSISLAGDKVRVEGSQEPDEETKGLLEALREHKEEVLGALAQDDPILPVDAWLPDYLIFRKEVYRQVKDSDIWGYARTKKPELYAELKKVEAKMDTLKDARLSRVMELLRQWRDLILKIQFEHIRAERNK